MWIHLTRPNFVLPLGKGDGKSATMLLQCQLPHVLFTGLEDVKQCVLCQWHVVNCLAHAIEQPIPKTFGHHSLMELKLGWAFVCRLGASAPPVLTITHYPELLDSHNLVLARADAISPHAVSVPEVQTG